MPRIARIKTNDSIFHVMCKSISEVDLFPTTEDKLEYLSLVKKYQKLYMFKVYGYCLMDNHSHFIIDVNGSDISRIMHSINSSYVRYFNIHHKRHGHLFQERFKSKIVKDEAYLFSLSAYIHNNPTSIDGFSEHPEKYLFSSLSIYLGINQDPFALVDENFIMGMFGTEAKTARENYLKFVFKSNTQRNIDEFEFKNVKTEYRSERSLLVRDADINEIILFIVKKMKISSASLYSKNCRNVISAKALAVFLMRSMCNFRCKDICFTLGNITQSRVSKLSSLGIELLKNKNYSCIVEEFIKLHTA